MKISQEVYDAAVAYTFGMEEVPDVFVYFKTMVVILTDSLINRGHKTIGEHNEWFHAVADHNIEVPGCSDYYFSNLDMTGELDVPEDHIDLKEFTLALQHLLNIGGYKLSEDEKEFIIHDPINVVNEGARFGKDDWFTVWIPVTFKMGDTVREYRFIPDVVDNDLTSYLAKHGTPSAILTYQNGEFWKRTKETILGNLKNGGLYYTDPIMFGTFANLGVGSRKTRKIFKGTSFCSLFLNQIYSDDGPVVDIGETKLPDISSEQIKELYAPLFDKKAS